MYNIEFFNPLRDISWEISHNMSGGLGKHLLNWIAANIKHQNGNGIKASRILNKITSRMKVLSLSKCPGIVLSDFNYRNTSNT